MDKPRKFMAKLPPDVHEWLGAAAAARHPWTMNDMLVKALRFYMSLPEDTIDDDGTGLRACCYTSPDGGHRGTCRYSFMRSDTGADFIAETDETLRQQDLAVRELMAVIDEELSHEHPNIIRLGAVRREIEARYPRAR